MCPGAAPVNRVAIGIEPDRATGCPRPKRKRDDRICNGKSVGVSIALGLEVRRRHNGETLAVSAAGRLVGQEAGETAALLAGIVEAHSGSHALCGPGCLS